MTVEERKISLDRDAKRKLDARAVETEAQRTTRLADKSERQSNFLANKTGAQKNARLKNEASAKKAKINQR